MIDHISIFVNDYEKSRAFYEYALEPLGYEVVMESPKGDGVGFGSNGKPSLWITRKDGTATKPHIHIALQAKNRKAVDDFYHAAIKAGGIDNGKPGLRTHYHPNYYAAFVLDPDGHNIEAVCHTPKD